MAKGRDRLIGELKRILEQKEDRIEYIPGALGMYNSTGSKVIKVPSRTDYVYVRIRGQISEVVEAFNDKVYLQFGLPVILVQDPLQPKSYKIIGRDTGKYQGWGSAGLPQHGNQHSFSDTTSSGRDVVFTYKRQMAQPLLCRPQATPNMTVYVEADFYFWNNSFVRFNGGSSASFAASLPSSSVTLRFATVYIDGGTNTVKFILGNDFLNSDIFPPTGGTVAQIPSISSSIGIPLCAVLLSYGMTSINWNVMYDIRPMLSTSAGTVPLPHALDPAQGLHTGSLPASNVSIVDTGNWFTGVNVELALQELGPLLYPSLVQASNVHVVDTGNYFTGINVEAALQELGPLLNAEDNPIISDGVTTFPNRRFLELNTGLVVTDEASRNATKVINDRSFSAFQIRSFRAFAPSGALGLDLPDLAEQILNVFNTGFEVDPATYSMPTGANRIDFDVPLNADALLTMNYLILRN